ncbi:CBL-interacting serine/threonine-protein kinase 7-like [Cucurbita pepo subsp. pepo]|uniref:CBL-interacting serine/threonine-protein kinase 7-like n=1 Tax=Cucurbita pepo subsp. pepo TaxID=3664 RepID=UPI000C9D3012|nr:CBL-interacting serine/threonine-protein kinase 7-like [Cucurbita pepo subsp. pepo]
MKPGLRPTPAAVPRSAGTTLLGKYGLGRLLGRGSFAKVYQAVSLADNSIVAVKIIDKSKTVGATLERCIVREIAAMRRLDHHPNILKIHEVMATKSKIYLVVEFAAGGELLAKISRRGRFTETVARRYFQQLVSALKFCHENGVVHRDVKPQNLLLDEQGNLKISDFGLSALPEKLKDELLHTACGTPAYSAPEVMIRRGNRGYDGGKADAWSCGVILFVMLSGFLPFEESNLAAMYKKIHRREFQIPKWISKPVRFLIYHLLDPNPETRMSIEALMQNPWFKKSLPRKQSNESLMQSMKNYRLGKERGIGEMNAFDIISMSSGLDLSGLFETTEKRAERRFTSRATVREVEERVREIGGVLGYEVEAVAVAKGGAIGMGKGRVVVVVEVVEMAVAPVTLTMVEVRVIKGGEEFEELHWRCFEAKLEGFAVPWQMKCNL